MLIKDELYGEFHIEPVLEELIRSKPVQRLKGIYQGGASYFVNPEWNGTRYDHSIGVMVLIKKFSGSIEEQIAGLLHDVSHTAFSHVIDFVFKNDQEDFHEQIFNQVIEDSEIPSILQKYGYHHQDILDDIEQWSLLEQPAPELCADRIDYTLRDMYSYGKISLDEVHAFLDNVIVVNGSLYIKELNTAEWFVKTYYQEVIDYFLDPLNVYGYELLAKIIKMALDKKLLPFSILLKTDQEAMYALKKTNDPEIQKLLIQLHPNVVVKEDNDHYDMHRKGKVRLIDPSVMIGDRLLPASQVSETVRNMNAEAKSRSEKGRYIKVFST
ncbi:HD domain-containing protein [Falsibacillus pallidus]|uniref:HD domain-containing protein n=1 Tax=Falsibacillus pallidus TaxID=493781 RepID=UPI003D95BFEB